MKHDMLDRLRPEHDGFENGTSFGCGPEHDGFLSNKFIWLRL
jgi:hypothetical protein